MCQLGIISKPNKVYVDRKEYIGSNKDKSPSPISKCQHFVQLQNKRRPNINKNSGLHYQKKPE